MVVLLLLLHVPSPPPTRLFDPFNLHLHLHIGSDLIPAFACFTACLMLGIPVGTFLGIGVNMLFIMYHAARPKIQMERRYVSHFIYRGILAYKISILLFFLPVRRH